MRRSGSRLLGSWYLPLFAAGILLGSAVFYASSCNAPVQKADGSAPAKYGSIADVEQALIKMQREWARAYLKRDMAAIERIVADDWIGVAWNGDTDTKAGELDEIKTGIYKVDSIDLDNLKVRVFGNAAVTTMDVREKSTYAGKDIGGHFRYTSTWVDRNGKWQVVASQGLKIQD
jgi:hypothetical protein